MQHYFAPRESFPQNVGHCFKAKSLLTTESPEVLATKGGGKLFKLEDISGNNISPRPFSIQTRKLQTEFAPPLSWASETIGELAARLEPQMAYGWLGSRQSPSLRPSQAAHPPTNPPMPPTVTPPFPTNPLPSSPQQQQWNLPPTTANYPPYHLYMAAPPLANQSPPPQPTSTQPYGTTATTAKTDVPQAEFDFLSRNVADGKLRAAYGIDESSSSEVESAVIITPYLSTNQQTSDGRLEPTLTALPQIAVVTPPGGGAPVVTSLSEDGRTFKRLLGFDSAAQRSPTLAGEDTHTARRAEVSVESLKQAAANSQLGSQSVSAVPVPATTPLLLMPCGMLPGNPPVAAPLGGPQFLVKPLVPPLSSPPLPPPPFPTFGAPPQTPTFGAPPPTPTFGAPPPTPTPPFGVSGPLSTYAPPSTPMVPNTQTVYQPAGVTTTTTTPQTVLTRRKSRCLLSRCCAPELTPTAIPFGSQYDFRQAPGVARGPGVRGTNTVVHYAVPPPPLPIIRTSVTTEAIDHQTQQPGWLASGPVELIGPY